MKYRRWGVLAFVLLFSACSKKQATEPKAASVEDFLLKDNEIGGWILTGNRWNASSSGELNQAIDGEEPVYTRHGFREGVMREYEGKVVGNAARVELRIFDQGKSENAKALFDELSLQLVGPTPWSPRAGLEGKIERTALSQRILFWDKAYIIQLSITSTLTEALDVLKSFAGNVVSKTQ